MFLAFSVVKNKMWNVNVVLYDIISFIYSCCCKCLGNVSWMKRRKTKLVMRYLKINLKNHSKEKKHQVIYFKMEKIINQFKLMGVSKNIKQNDIKGKLIFTEKKCQIFLCATGLTYIFIMQSSYLQQKMSMKNLWCVLKLGIIHLAGKRFEHPRRSVSFIKDADYTQIMKCFLGEVYF